MKTLVFREVSGDNTVKVGYGTTFKNEDTGDFFILAAVTIDKVVLINMKDGCRFTEPVKVQSIQLLSREEWNTVTYGEEFSPVSVDVKEQQ